MISWHAFLTKNSIHKLLIITVNHSLGSYHLIFMGGLGWKILSCIFFSCNLCPAFLFFTLIGPAFFFLVYPDFFYLNCCPDFFCFASVTSCFFFFYSKLLSCLFFSNFILAPPHKNQMVAPLYPGEM